MFWDESNRLRVVYDQNSYQMQHYIYDAAGERTLKASSKIENVYENGQVEANTTTMGLYTTYVSPYMVVDANQKYSKHYFNGTQRVASKIGEQDIAIFENGNQYLKQANNKAAENTPATDFDTLKNTQITDFSYYLSKSTNNATDKNLKVNYTKYKTTDTNTDTTTAKATENNSAYAAPQYAEIYYYHSDHLGTGTFLSDFDGNPYQFFLNLPFGETMAEQHSYSGDYTNRYKFNGKELDEETGFYYYGARYYNPKFSIWLTTDPLAEKFPNASPYAYCLNNPVNMVDPDGREGKPVNGNPDWASQFGHYVHQRANYEGIWNRYSNKPGISEKGKITKPSSLTELNKIQDKVSMINQGTAYADTAQFQTGEYSYRHAMRNDDETIEQAKTKADLFVREKYNEALCLKNNGEIEKAYFELGVALHTVQDATSPSHAGFQMWNGEESLIKTGEHVVNELYYPGKNSNLQNVTNFYINLFELGKELPKENLFNNIKADK